MNPLLVSVVIVLAVVFTLNYCLGLLSLAEKPLMVARIVVGVLGLLWLLGILLGWPWVTVRFPR